MCIKQILVSLENVPGKLLEVSECLGAEGINIRAISVADTSHVSTVRLVADDPEKAINVLKSRGYLAQEVEVIAVEIPDHPGRTQAAQAEECQCPLPLSLSGQGRKRAGRCYYGRGQYRKGGAGTAEELGPHLRERDLRPVI